MKSLGTMILSLVGYFGSGGYIIIAFANIGMTQRNTRTNPIANFVLISISFTYFKYSIFL